MNGRQMTRTEIRAPCETLGFDDDMVTQIIVYPDHVEVTVWVPIVEEP